MRARQVGVDSEETTPGRYRFAVASIARWIGIVTAVGCCRRGSRGPDGCARSHSRIDAGMCIPAAMPNRRMETASDEAASKAACRKPIDEQRRWPVGVGKTALEHIDIKGQIAAVELRGLQ